MLYDDQLLVNTKALEKLGIDVDDGPVKPARPMRGVLVTEKMS
ncbi:MULTISPECIES: hypothetical protein [unclassified Methylobacterium]|nr:MULTISPECIES: hypothetical protein [unclassified Methylobacterium]